MTNIPWYCSCGDGRKHAETVSNRRGDSSSGGGVNICTDGGTCNGSDSAVGSCGIVINSCTVYTGRAGGRSSGITLISQSNIIDVVGFDCAADWDGRRADDIC